MRQIVGLALSTVMVFATSVWLAAQRSDWDLGFSTDSNQVVLSFTYIHHMLAEPDPVPLMRIYGDGRVHIHYPVYMQRSGDYELQLAPLELRQLLLSVAETGAIDFRAEDVDQLRREERKRLEKQGVLFHISDTTEMVMELHLAWYEAPGLTGRIETLDKTIRWGNVTQEAQLFGAKSELQGLAKSELQGLAESELLLQSLLERKDIRRMTQAEDGQQEQ